jgi:hypothetical protein
MTVIRLGHKSKRFRVPVKAGEFAEALKGKLNSLNDTSHGRVG